MARPVANTKPAEEETEPQGPHEIAGVSVLVLALFVGVSLVSEQFGDGLSNVGGPAGSAVAWVVLEGFGLAAYLLPIGLVGLGLTLFRDGTEPLRGGRFAGAGLFLLAIAILLGLFGDVGDGRTAGGLVGGLLATLAHDAIGAFGAYLTSATFFVFGVLLFAELTFRDLVRICREATVSRLTAMRRAPLEIPAVVTRSQPDIVVSNRPRLQPTFDEDAPVILLDNIVEPAPKPRPRAQQHTLPLGIDTLYEVPGSHLLDAPDEHANHVDEEQLRRSAEILETKLANFGIQGKVVAVRPGPVITTFEIEPAPGVKVTRITALQDDLTMALRALGVRILAPVPGKAVVGIEVANANREIVRLRQIVEAEEFASSKSAVTLALGKDSVGHPVAADLAKMPHLLLAGATGTGKSVSLNAMIMSILMKASPRDVRMVMIDLKMLELSLYEDLPHQLVPVVTDPKSAVVVLKNLVEEMDNRYRILKEKGVRNIDAYNQVLAEQGGSEVFELTEVIEDGEDEPVRPLEAHRHVHMPRIVVIIDELADLMMTSGRQAEDPITRLAQKARACGIHLILATQRPSVDVITGLIKANFPARMSFQVTSRIDSRTILDQMGAERLLGNGDMLFLPPGGRVRRLHGAYVSEEEIHTVTTYCRGQGAPQYEMQLLESDEDEGEGGAGEGNGGPTDELYDMAVRVVTESRRGTISWLQRKLGVGYNRAAKMIEQMEREGIIVSRDGGRTREVVAPPPPED